MHLNPEWRTSGNIIKVQIGGINASVVTIQYMLHPAAQDDSYLAIAGVTRSVAPQAGLLQNDTSPTRASLSVAAASPPQGLTLASDGSFSFASTTPGLYNFNYRASDGQTESLPANCTINLLPSNTYLAEDFSDAAALSPSSGWVNVNGKWTVAGGSCVAGPNPGGAGTLYLPPGNNWSGNYSVEAQIRFQAGAYGGGIAARVSPTGARYGVWVYPEDSPASGPVGPKKIALIKFPGWDQSTWSSLGSAAMDVGAGWHTVKLVCSGTQPAQLSVFVDGALSPAIQATDPNDLPSGGVGLDMYTYSGGSACTMSVDHLIVTP